MGKPKFVQTHILKGHNGAISCARFSPEGSLIISAATDGNLVLWGKDENDVWLHKSTLSCHKLGISETSFSSNSKQVTTASDDGSAKIFDVESCKQISKFCGHTKQVLCSSLDPEMKLFLTGSFDEVVKLWDVKSGKCIKSLTAHSDPITSVNFKPDGKMFVTAGFDGLTRIWDTSSCQCAHTLLTDSTHAVSYARFSPNGKFILAGTMDSKLRLWDYQKSKCLKTYQGHKNSKYSMFSSFSVSNGLWVMSGSEDKTVVIWNLQNKEILQKLHGHSDIVISVDSHPKSDMIVSGALEKDGTVCIWENNVKNSSKKPVEVEAIAASKRRHLSGS